MEVTEQDITMYQGDSAIVQVYVTNADLTAKDLTSSIIHWVVYDNNTEVIYIDKTNVDSTDIVISSPESSGIFTITIDEEDTEEMKPGDWYRHEGEVIDISGNTSTVVVGMFKLIRSIA